VLHHIALYYFGSFGSILLGITITFACLKTSIGLITACSTAFAQLFPRACSYHVYVILFCLFSCAVANVGLSRIIGYSLPALYFLYPISMMLIVLCLLEAQIGYRRSVFVCGMIGTGIAAVFDLLRALPPGIREILPAYTALRDLGDMLPFAALGIPIETCVAWRNELIEPADFLSRDEKLIAVLQTLKKSYALVCVTNNPVSVGRKTLCALGVEDCIASVIGLDTFGKSKPAREPFEKAAEETGAEIAECLSVGDRYDIDIVLPLDLGMGGILVDGVSDVYELPNVLNFSRK